jgi:SAM-dependent methyltransferase
LSTLQSVPDLSVEELRAEVKKEYADVAQDPGKGYHFHTGREAAARLGYDEALYTHIPEGNIESFAGMGNPFILGPISRGDVVVDIGSGSGFDSLIAAKMVGPEGRVVGVDMTEEMLAKARDGAAEIEAAHVEFKRGFAEDVPLSDDFADVIISNGVLNITVDKVETLREWARVLRPGGRLQLGDILVAREVPESALDDISLWTG